MLNILTLFLSYLIGSFSFALVIGKLFYKTDIRGYGSGNLGATNVYRVLGKKAGLIVAIADLLKGTFACLLPQILNSAVNPIICGLLAILGHVFPIFAGFKGGKAVATATGVLLFLTPLGTLNWLCCISINFDTIKVCFTEFNVSWNSHIYLQPYI
jgi:acyl phosphate:glycerol-3-phosphate acyltransferase